MVRRMIATAAVGLISLGVAACGDGDSGSNDDPAPAACLVGDEDCYETGAEPSSD